VAHLRSKSHYVAINKRNEVLRITVSVSESPDEVTADSAHVLSVELNIPRPDSSHYGAKVNIVSEELHGSEVIRPASCYDNSFWAWVSHFDSELRRVANLFTVGQRDTGDDFIDIGADVIKRVRSHSKRVSIGGVEAECRHDVGVS